jgi:hypothetical protein
MSSFSGFSFETGERTRLEGRDRISPSHTRQEAMESAERYRNNGAPKSINVYRVLCHSLLKLTASCYAHHRWLWKMTFSQHSRVNRV